MFTGFVLVGLFGFGGIAASFYHVSVERRKWLSTDEYAQTLAVGQILPGASLINMSTIVADRFHGLLGVALALLGLFAFPLIILIALITTYDQFSHLPDVQSATKAAAAAAVGLTFGIGLKLAKDIIRSGAGLVFAILSFLLIGIFRLPMLQSIFGLVTLSIVFSIWQSKK
ncbi:MAG: chromate transporter [Betaproteobacteria bacterium]